jgi:predicted rRNA methylase YqxC with S4 and FtsJ domains
LKEEFLEEVLENVRRDISGLHIEIVAETESPIEGKRGGNIEYLFHCRKAA